MSPITLYPLAPYAPFQVPCVTVSVLMNTAVLAVPLLALPVLPSAAGTEPEPRVETASVPSGQRLFIANCAPCHGATAHGGAVGGGALAPALDVATPVQVAEAMLIGPGEMPVFSGLPQGQRDAVVSYVAFLQAQPNPGGVSIGAIGPVPEGFAAWVLGLGLILIVVLVVGHDWRRGR